VFAKDGKFLKQIGEPKKNTDSNSTTHFGKVAEIAIDEKLNEAYVADGYGNKRVVVLDTNTYEFKRYWGAYGNKPVDEPVPRYAPGETPPQQFRGPVHCAQPSNDGLLYVCDRMSDRIQIFKRDGTFVTEKVIAPKTLSQGSTWDVAFSRDKEQKYMYVVDGQNMKVYIMDRKSLEVLYTTETYEGKRIQKFAYQGIKSIPQNNAGPAWPKKAK
jgi:hypothetical protein